MLLLLDAGGALLVAALGILLICAEFCLPGWVSPGVAGGVCVMCGAYRLSMLGSEAVVAIGLFSVIAGAAAAGYGLAPEWLGFTLLLSVPWLCRALVPGTISWPVAGLAAIPVAVMFVLLRVAARAAANKTLLQ
jgi:membrane-bound serine protease (ClpP class)